MNPKPNKIHQRTMDLLTHLVLFEASIWQSSMDKRSLGLKVVKTNGEEIDTFYSLGEDKLTKAKNMSWFKQILSLTVTPSRQSHLHIKTIRLSY